METQHLIESRGNKELIELISNAVKFYPTRVVASGVRDASQAFIQKARTLNNVFPKLYNAKVFYKRKRGPVVIVGAFRGVGSSHPHGGGRKKGLVWERVSGNERFKGDNYISQWQRNIWLEYGTLSNRAKGHRFRSPRKPKTSSWKGGIKPNLATERAWESTRSIVFGKIPSCVRKRAEAYDKRQGKDFRSWLFE